MTRIAPLAALLLAVSLTPARAQDRIEPPGRQVVESDGVLAEITYASDRVRVRLFDLDGEPLDLRALWLRRCSIAIAATHGGGEVSASRAVRLVEPEGGEPYLEARHQIGPLADQDRLVVSLHLKNVDGRGDRTFRVRAEWARVEERLRCCSSGPTCEGARCLLCARDLCRR